MSAKIPNAKLNAMLLDFDLTPVRGVRQINSEAIKLMFKDVPESVKVYARELRDAGWKFHAVDQTRGYCDYKYKIITIPTWVILKRSVQEKTWYIAHELAHAFDVKRSHHGDSFMQMLVRICPADCIHYELGYKPRNAARNGIVQPLLDL